MNPLSTFRARRLAQPHLPALLAALTLPATVGAQATNHWRCAGGGWNGDPVCWSLGTSHITQNVVIPAGPMGSDLMLLTAIGNTVSVRSLIVGAARTEASTSATAYLYASGSTLNVTGEFNNPGYIGVGVANNAHAQLTLTNSTLNIANGVTGGINGRLEVGAPATGQPSFTPGFGALSVQANSCISGNVIVNNGRIDVFGSTNAAYSAVSGGVSVSDNSLANMAGGLNFLGVRGGRALVGTTNANLATPVLNQVQNSFGTIDFVGRSRVGFTFLGGGVTTVKARAAAGHGWRRPAAGCARAGPVRRAAFPVAAARPARPARGARPWRRARCDSGFVHSGR